MCSPDCGGSPRCCAGTGREIASGKWLGLVTSCNLFRGRHQPQPDLAPLAPAPRSHEDFLNLDIDTLMNVQCSILKHLSQILQQMGLNRVDWGLVVGLAIHVAKWAHSPNIVNIHYRFQNLRTLVFSLPWQLCPHPCVGMVTGRGHCVRVATNCWHQVPMFQCSNVPMTQVQVPVIHSATSGYAATSQHQPGSRF